ncbi:MAG: MATE family efflux transporter [Myxococcales bacterium]|nr:MATE family efflux transporter [Myxococcales bacterium]
MTTVRSRLFEELSSTLKLAAPLCFAMAGSQFLTLFDTAVVGRVSAAALAGTGTGSSIFFVSIIVALGILMGLDPVAAQAVGAGDPARARRALREATRLVLLVTLPAMGAAFALYSSLPLLGMDEAVHHEAGRYLLGRAPSALIFLFAQVQRSYLQALGHARPSFMAMVAANVVNLPLAWFLVLGDSGLTALGLPALGLGEGLGSLGAGLAASIAFTVQCLVLHRALQAIPVPPGTGAPTREGMLEIGRLGLPVGLQFAAEMGIFALVQFLIGAFGEVWAASHNVAVQLISFTFTACLGLSQAAAVRVGHGVGRGDWRAARRAGFVAIGVGAAVMGFSSIFFATYSVTLASLFAHDPVVVETASRLILIAAIFQVVDGVQGVAGGVLRGAGDTRAAMWINVCAHWGVSFPFVLYFGRPEAFGAIGMWWSLTCGLTLVAIGLPLRFAWQMHQRLASLPPR